MILQKHERAALDAARSILGPSVTLTAGRKFKVLHFGDRTHKLAMGTDDDGDARRKALRWARGVRG